MKITTLSPKVRMSRNESLLKSCGQILGCAALTALASKAHFFLPFSPVPITLQTLTVILSGALLGSRKGVLSQVMLIGFACTGLSVFANPGPGYLALSGPTAGYIYGFILSAFAAGFIVERGLSRVWWKAILGFWLASSLMFVPGLLWLRLLTHQSFTELLMIGFYPFLLGDFLKAVAAVGFLRGLRR